MKNETKEAIARNSMGLFRLGRKTELMKENQDKLLEAHVRDNDRNLKESLARIETLEENESLTIETLDCQIKRIVAQDTLITWLRDAILRTNALLSDYQTRIKVLENFREDMQR